MPNHKDALLRKDTTPEASLEIQRTDNSSTLCSNPLDTIVADELGLIAIEYKEGNAKT